MWHKLRRRKLVQWAFAYLAGAWAVLEVFDLVGSQFGWPSLLMRSFTIALGLGFFLVLVLAWYHGERGEQRVSGAELLILGVLLSLCGGLMWRYARTTQPAAAIVATQVATRPGGDASAAPAAPIPEGSIAVLPFANDSDDSDQQYFSDGLSEDLITALSQFSALKVVSRNSAFLFRNSQDNSKLIGQKLGVAHLLEGSVRRSGDTVRISAQLVRAVDGSTIWSQRFDRPYRELFKLQDEITAAVAGALEAKLMAADGVVVQSDRPPSGNLEAYNAYLRGRFIAARGTLPDKRAAIAHYEAAIRLDPRYAAAHARSSVIWTHVGGWFLGGREQQVAFDRARADAAAALALAPDLALAHLAQANVLLNVDFDWTGAEAQSRLALQLAPQDGEAKFQLGMLQATLGHLREAVTLTRQALVADPLQADWFHWLSMYLTPLGLLDEAERASMKEIELQPTQVVSHMQLAIIAIRRGDAAAALRWARQEPATGGWHGPAVALALQIGPDRAAADAALQSLIETDASKGAYQIAQVYALRQQPTEAFAWLDRAWRQRDPGVTQLLYDPFLLRYAHDPRFAEFCREVGLPVPGTDPPATSP